MEKTYIGAVHAHMPQPDGAKAKYPRVGSAFEDSEGRLSVKLDSLPIGTNWSGWLNIFPPKEDNGF